jgi:hypothetical protein
MISISGAPPNSLAGGLPPPPYYDNYSGPANPACFLTLDSPNDWAGQSFTTSKACNLKRVELWIKKGPGSNIGNVDVEIYGTAFDHPQVPILNSGIIANADVSEEYSWVPCYLDGFYLHSTDTKYCIVVHGASLDVDNTLIWACGGDGSGLPNGDQEWSIDGGTVWSTDTTRDQLFRCYPIFLQEKYNDEGQGNDQHGSYVNFECAQTFTPQKDFAISGVRLYLKRLGEIGDVTVGIYKTSGLLPFGEAKVSAVVDGSGWDDGGYDWIEWKFDTPYALSKDELYAIWLSGAGYDAVNCPLWRLDKTDPAYVDGNIVFDTGAGWWSKIDWDFLFETWTFDE